VVGVFDRMEIWDRETHERYESGHGGAYQAGTLAPATRRQEKE
jgi:DNA-binding transcriptional regulator/RsmH inhibitor MraZ